MNQDSAEDLDLEIQLLALEIKNARSQEIFKKKQAIAQKLKQQDLEQFRAFRRRAFQTFKQYMFSYGVPTYFGTLLVTRSIAIFPTIFTTAGYFLYSSAIRNSSKTLSHPYGN